MSIRTDFVLANAATYENPSFKSTEVTFTYCFDLGLAVALYVIVFASEVILEKVMCWILGALIKLYFFKFMFI